MSSRDSAPVVLITGCSTGIGLETARTFGRRGWRVFAGVRDPEGVGAAGLRQEADASGWRLSTPRLDVTQPDTVEAAVGTLLGTAGGRLDVLVNNAGYLLTGALEETRTEEIERLFATLVFGVHRVTRAVLPAMRSQRSGRIVVVSSVAARTVIPVLGAYSAAKAAVEAMAEAWRYELTPSGIDVVIVEPGAFTTALHRNEVRATGDSSSPYRDLTARFDARSLGVRREAAERAARTVERAATAPRPPLRWPVGPLSWLGGRLGPALPRWLLEGWVRRAFGLRPRGGPPPGGQGAFR